MLCGLPESLNLLESLKRCLTGGAELDYKFSGEEFCAEPDS